MGYCIRFTKGDLAGRSFPVTQMASIVGRSRSCTISLPRNGKFSSFVSRQHVALRLEDDGVLLTALSDKATKVNGCDVSPEHKLRLSIGNVVSLGGDGQTEFILDTEETDDDEFHFDADSSVVPGRGDHPTESGHPTDATFFGNPATEHTSAPPSLKRSADDATDTDNTIFGGVSIGDTDPAQTEMAPMPDQPMDALSRGETPTGAMPRGDAPTGGRPAEGVSERPTVPFGTVHVTKAEIEALIEEDKKRRTRKLKIKVGIAVGSFLIAAGLYYFTRPQPEKVLSWPTLPTGAYDTKTIDLDTPVGKANLWIVYPGNAASSVRTSTNGEVCVRTFLGARRDVPFRIDFSWSRNAKNLHQDQRLLFSQYRRDLEERGGWNFFALSPMGFIGRDNGLPYLEMQYLRTEKAGGDTSQWFGYLLFATIGDCALTMTREIPAADQWRGGVVLATEHLLCISSAAEETVWSGGSNLRRGMPDAMLVEAEGLTSRRAPLLWMDAEFLLRSVLASSSPEDRVFAKATDRLKALREDERREFNRLKAVWEQQNVAHDKDGCRQTLEEALRIFTSDNDRRKTLLKKGRWK